MKNDKTLTAMLLPVIESGAALLVMGFILVTEMYMAQALAQVLSKTHPAIDKFLDVAQMILEIII